MGCTTICAYVALSIARAENNPNSGFHTATTISIFSYFTRLQSLDTGVKTLCWYSILFCFVEHFISGKFSPIIGAKITLSIFHSCLSKYFLQVSLFYRRHSISKIFFVRKGDNNQICFHINDWIHSLAYLNPWISVRVRWLFSSIHCLFRIVFNGNKGKHFDILKIKHAVCHSNISGNVSNSK